MKFPLILLFLLTALVSFSNDFDPFLRRKQKASFSELGFTFQNEVLQYDSISAFKALKKVLDVPQFDAAELNLFHAYLTATYYGGGLEADVNQANTLYVSLIKKLEATKQKSSFQENVLANSYQNLAFNILLHQENKERYALRYFLKSEAIYNRLGYETCFFGFQALSNLGEFYFRMKEYPTAMHYLERAEKLIHLEKWDWAKINFYNTKGLCYGYLKQGEAAIENYKKIASFVHQAKDSVWIGISSGNIASEYMKLKQFEQAKAYLLIDLSYSLKYDEKESIFELYCSLAETEVALGNTAKAWEYISAAEAMEIVQGDAYYIMRLRLKKALYYNAIGNYKAAYAELAAGTEAKTAIDKKLRQNKILASAKQFELELKQQKLQQVNKERENALFQRNLFLVIIILSIVSVFFVLRYLKEKARQKTAELQFKQTLLQQELTNAESQLTAFRDNVNRQNEFISSIKEELEVLKENSTFVDNESLLEKLNESNIVTQQDWVQFSALFSRIHPGFIQRLQDKYPNLTPNEIRLLVLTKLAYSTKEMAGMLGVSLDAIHKSRYRLRKKLELPEEDNFTDLIS
jgi:tetratricopeptide (TPR) repeat protein